MLISDLHTHSDNSFDAKNSVEDMVKTAIDRGLYAIAITDHCEAPFIQCGENCEFGSFDKKIPKSILDTQNAKAKYNDKIKVLCGIELGEPMHDMQQTVHALNYGDFDFILASVHNLRGMEDFYYLDYSALDVDLLLHNYFIEVAETASFEHFDCLAHLTYPLRYIFEEKGWLLDLVPFQKQIDEILNILIKNNKALEINVSGLYKPMKTTLPDLSVVKRFKELGGKYITLGTDAHSTDSVGKGIEDGIKIAKQAGFSYYTIYEKHIPILIDID